MIFRGLLVFLVAIAMTACSQIPVRTIDDDRQIKKVGVIVNLPKRIDIKAKGLLKTGNRSEEFDSSLDFASVAFAQTQSRLRNQRSFWTVERLSATAPELTTLSGKNLHQEVGKNNSALTSLMSQYRSRGFDAIIYVDASASSVFDLPTGLGLDIVTFHMSGKPRVYVVAHLNSSLILADSSFAATRRAPVSKATILPIDTFGLNVDLSNTDAPSVRRAIEEAISQEVVQVLNMTLEQLGY